jgi:hypothetical protein
VATTEKNNNKLHPNFLTGFVDGEGCFSVSIYKNNKLKTGWTVSPEFSIHLHGRDTKLLHLIQSYFGAGTIRSTKSDGSILFSVKSLKHITNIIIPHFDKYPLLTQKRADFLLFKMVIELINKKEHLTTEGLYTIVGIRAAMNLGLTKELMKSFPNIMPVNRPVVEAIKLQDSN